MKKKLARAISLVIVGTSTVAGIAVPVFAQSPELAEEIVVTGTRLRGEAPVGTAVQVLGRDQIENSGQVTIDRIIKDIPQNFDLGVSENSRSQSGGAGNIVYSNTVNLRGIGPYATLVMIDSHRAINNSRSIEPSMLPTLGIDRVEVIADGSSAIYGSDAIAGVVNLIPRRNFNGVEAFARYGVAADDFNESVFGVAAGRTWERGQFMVAYEHVQRDRLSGDDRDFFSSNLTSQGGNDYRVTRCNPGNIKAGGINYAIPAGGVTQANGNSLVAGTINSCEDLQGQDLFPEQEYDSANMTASYDISDTVTLFADGFYSKRTFSRNPSFAAATLSVPSTNAFFVRPAGFTGNSYTLDYSFADDLPQDTATGQALNWEISPGLRIDLPNDWQFEGVMTYGENDDQADQFHGINNGALAVALASSDPTKAFDPYGLGRTNSTVLEGLANQIFLAPTLNEFLGYELRVNGGLFELPGGTVGLAAGYESQDIDVALGSARGNPGTAISFRDFNRKVDSVYAEILVPVIGEENSRAGMEKLAFTAALRYDDYSDVGSTSNQKFGITWVPVSGFSARASYGTSFRAPLITQIYGNSNALFGQSYQNLGGGAPVQGFARSGPNLNLKPEEATSWSAGFDWDITPALSASVTYFDIDYRNQVEAYLGNLSILSRESEFNGLGIILRGTAAANKVIETLASGVGLARGSFPGGNPANVELYVDGRNNNLGKSQTNGFDFLLSYDVQTQNVGSFTFNVNGMYLTNYEVAITENAPLVDQKNTIFNPLDFKMRASVNWALDQFQGQLALTRVGSYTNNLVAPHESVDSYIPVDLRLAYTFDGSSMSQMLEGLNVGLELRNMFDEEPPFVNIAKSGNGSGGYDATSANPIGRLFALTVRKSW